MSEKWANLLRLTLLLFVSLRPPRPRSPPTTMMYVLTWTPLKCRYLPSFDRQEFHLAVASVGSTNPIFGRS